MKQSNTLLSMHETYRGTLGFCVMLTMTLLIAGCDSIVDHQKDSDVGISTVDALTANSTHETTIACIDQDNPEYKVQSQTETVEWGNKKNPFEKAVDIEYFNTLDEFVLRVRSSRAIADVLIDEESVMDFDGSVTPGEWQEFILELEEGWQAGDSKSFSVKVAGSGPPAFFEVDYTLIGECVTPCGDPVTFMYNGSEVTYGTVTGANGSCWLDRNMGAVQVAESSTDEQAYGDYLTFDESSNACPVGFELPTEIEWEAERGSWSSDNAAGAFGSSLKLTMPGITSSGSFIRVGTAGTYWSSNLSGTFVRSLYFASSESYMFSSGAFVGRTARCIRA